MPYPGEIAGIGTAILWAANAIFFAEGTKKTDVGSIMKCNTLESERDFVILRMYAQKIPTSWTEGTGGDREYA